MRRIALPALATLAVGAGLLAQLAAAPYALWLANGAWTGAALFAVLALTRACRRIDDAEQKRPWAYLLVACWCWLAGQVAWDLLTATGTASWRITHWTETLDAFGVTAPVATTRQIFDLGARVVGPVLARVFSVQPRMSLAFGVHIPGSACMSPVRPHALLREACLRCRHICPRFSRES